MQNRRQTQRVLWLCTLILTLTLLDQWIKQLVQTAIGPGADTHRIELLGRFVALEYLQNRGAAFGMFPQATPILAAISVIALVVGVVVIWRNAMDGPVLAVAVSIVVAGALGNMIDRVVRGYVIDYIAVGDFWRFNLADSAVTVGALLIVAYLWQVERTATLLNQDKE